MSSTAEPKAPPTNRVGLTVKEYGGSKSTLCVGCGHDVITRQITQAIYEMSIPPYKVAKMSGIGCSSKTTAYFADRGHGFNAVHGRMPAVATGAMMVNPSLLAVGVSGDGDTASIGAGQFVHLLRRNVPMVYIVENNGVYGLTKGQFSATADAGSKLKTGVVNDLPAIDLCAMAIELGCGYVARSFSGDMKQLVALLKGALAHRGTALLDVVSPCVTFNNHDSSTKSYKWAKDHEIPIHEIGFVPYYEDISGRLRPGHDPGRRAPRRLAPPSEEGPRRLRPDRQDDGAPSAARDGAAWRVRDRRPLRRAGQGRLHQPPRPRRRAAREPAPRACAPREGRPR